MRNAGPVPGCSAADPPVTLTPSPKSDLPGERVGCGCKVLAPGTMTARLPVSLIPPMQGWGGLPWPRSVKHGQLPVPGPCQLRGSRGTMRCSPAELCQARWHLTRPGSARRSAPARFGRCQTQASASSSASSLRSAWEEAELCSHTAAVGGMLGNPSSPSDGGRAWVHQGSATRAAESRGRAGDTTPAEGPLLGPRYLQTSSPKSASSRVNMKSITTNRYRSCPTHVSQHWGDK